MTVTETPPPPSMHPPSTGPEAQAQRKGRGLAIAALVLGLCSIFPCIGMFTALTAIVLAIVSLATRRRGTGLAIAGLVIAVVVGFLSLTLGIAVLLPSLSRSREAATRAICAANLNEIGRGIIMYASSYDDAHPPTLRHLIDDGQPADIFVCPSTGTEVRETPPYVSDYFYLPPDPNAPNETIVACESMGNHEDYRNALFADFHVHGFTEEAFQALLEEPQNTAFAAALRAVEREQEKLKDKPAPSDSDQPHKGE